MGIYVDFSLLRPHTTTPDYIDAYTTLLYQVHTSDPILENRIVPNVCRVERCFRPGPR